MKFLMIVLAIRLVGEMISMKKKDNKNRKVNAINEKIFHPAEFNLRG